MALIEVGQRYRELGAAGAVWQVVGVAKEWDGIRHYRIAKLVDPSTVKLLSESILTDTRHFRRESTGN